MQRNTPALALAADIGGTNVRFALTQPDAPGPPRLTEMRTFRSDDFASVEEAIDAYLKAIGLKTCPRRAAMAVAAPIRGDLVTLTNHPWKFSISKLCRRFGCDRLDVFNDFAAMALSLPHLQAKDLHAVGNVKAGAASTGVLGLVGPGTGLGVGCLIRRNGRDEALASEGGHMSFAPGNRLEADVVRLLLERFARVSYERLLSGPGLVNLHWALAAAEGTQADNLSPVEITRRGTGESGGLCRRTMDVFCAVLGAFAGDVALLFGAERMYIGGGMAPRFLDFLDASDFRARFEAKGRYRDMMRTMPTDVILHRQPGLLGAAAALGRGRPPQSGRLSGSAPPANG